MITVTRRYEWDMAHRLPEHSGKCSRLHGHRYVAEIDVEGEIDQASGSSHGMVLDFGDLDPSLRYRRKIYQRIEPIFEPSGASGTVTCEVYTNGTLRQTLTFDPTIKRDPKILTCGDGHTISVKLTQSGAGANYKLLGLLIYFTPGNEDSEAARG